MSAPQGPISSNTTLAYSTNTPNSPVNKSRQLDVGMVIGIIISALLILTLIILLLLYFFKFRELFHRYIRIAIDKCLGIFKHSDRDLRPLTSSYWTNIYDKAQSRKLILCRKNIVEGFTFQNEYDEFRIWSSNKKLENKLNMSKDSVNKNDRVIRYLVDKSDCDDGYVHSNNKVFLFSTVPYDLQTFADFLLMIYTNNISRILMCTQDATSVKNNIYWPQKSAVYNQIEVTMVTEAVYSYFDVRTFKLEKLNELKLVLVTHYLYRGCLGNNPSVNASFLDFHQMTMISNSSSHDPVLVLYSQNDSSDNALFVCFDILRDQLIYKSEVNVLETCSQLKEKVPDITINNKQYMLLYDLLFESYFGGQPITSTVDLAALSGSFLEEQFKFLNESRFITNNNIPTTGKYVNYGGVYLDQNIILVPKIDEVGEIWSNVFANNIYAIVNLNYQNFDEMFYTSQQLQNYIVSVKNVTKCENDVISQTVLVTQICTNSARNVIIYSFGTRKTFNFNGEHCTAMVELIHDILRHCQFNILVFKTDKSYLDTAFIVCFFAATKMESFKCVSVYYTIRSLQSSGNKIVQNCDQYKFIYEFLRLWKVMKMKNHDLAVHESGEYEDVRD